MFFLFLDVESPPAFRGCSVQPWASLQRHANGKLLSAIAHRSGRSLKNKLRRVGAIEIKDHWCRNVRRWYLWAEKSRQPTNDRYRLSNCIYCFHWEPRSSAASLSGQWSFIIPSEPLWKRRSRDTTDFQMLFVTAVRIKSLLNYSSSSNERGNYRFQRDNTNWEIISRRGLRNFVFFPYWSSVSTQIDPVNPRGFRTGIFVQCMLLFFRIWPGRKRRKERIWVKFYRVARPLTIKNHSLAWNTYDWNTKYFLSFFLSTKTLARERRWDWQRVIQGSKKYITWKQCAPARGKNHRLVGENTFMIYAAGTRFCNIASRQKALAQKTRKLSRVGNLFSSVPFCFASFCVRWCCSELPNTASL